MGRAEAAALLCLGLTAASPPPSATVALPGGRTVTLTAEPDGAATRLRIDTAGQPGAAASVLLERDETVPPQARLLGFSVIGTLDDRVLMLTDSYASAAGGLSYCQAGQERFLRVLALAPPMRETLRLKLDSCRQNVELATDGLRWQPARNELSVDWLAAPGTDQLPAVETYRIAPSGSVELVAPQP